MWAHKQLHITRHNLPRYHRQNPILHVLHTGSPWQGCSSTYSGEIQPSHHAILRHTPSAGNMLLHLQLETERQARELAAARDLLSHKDKQISTLDKEVRSLMAERSGEAKALHARSAQHMQTAEELQRQVGPGCGNHGTIQYSIVSWQCRSSACCNVAVRLPFDCYGDVLMGQNGDTVLPHSFDSLSCATHLFILPLPQVHYLQTQLRDAESEVANSAQRVKEVEQALEAEKRRGAASITAAGREQEAVARAVALERELAAARADIKVGGVRGCAL